MNLNFTDCLDEPHCLLRWLNSHLLFPISVLVKKQANIPVLMELTFYEGGQKKKKSKTRKSICSVVCYLAISAQQKNQSGRGGVVRRQERSFNSGVRTAVAEDVA